MTDNKFDFNKLKDSMGGLVDNLKSMINPGGGTPTVSPDDGLGLKIAQITILIKEISSAQSEYVEKLNKINELLNSAFHDIEILRTEKKADATDHGASD